MNIRNFIYRLLSLTIAASSIVLAAAEKPEIIRLDYAYYNPLSLVLKEKKWLEEDLAKDEVTVEWVFSQGSNKSLEYLNSDSVDFGSTAGVAAFISRANNNPVKSVYVASKPEWTALLVASGSPIKSVEELKGKKVAVTKGTDPFVFLARALDKAGLSLKDIEVVSLQHPEGKNALLNGDVDAWSGLDPLMAQAEVDAGAKLIFRNPDFNTYDVLNVSESFAKNYPEYVVRVLNAYEKARLWALANSQEYKSLFTVGAKLNDAVASRVLERTDISDSVIGDKQKKTIAAAGEVLKKNGVIGEATDIEAVVNDLIDSSFVHQIK